MPFFTKRIAPIRNLHYTAGMISLIVNADDLGINPQRDRGIIEAFQHGIVTSATVIANGPSFATAVAAAQSTSMPTGVHLNLSDGITLSGSIAGLTDSNHRFPGKQALRQYLLSGQLDLKGIRREFAAQIETVLASGLQPGHLDGHQHCQSYPPLTGLIVELAREYGFDAMRSSCPADPAEAAIPPDLVDDLALFRTLGTAARATILAAGFRTPDGLWGLPLLHSLNTANLCALLERIPHGNWELMTHPGYPCAEGRPFESAQREVERQALCAGPARAVIERRAIRLSTYGDLPCAP